MNNYFSLNVTSSTCLEGRKDFVRLKCKFLLLMEKIACDPDKQVPLLPSTKAIEGFLHPQMPPIEKQVI